MILVTPAIECICSLMALFFLRNEKRNIWVLLKWFIVFTTAFELLAYTYSLLSQKYNLWMFVLYLPFDFTISYWALYKLSPYHKVNKFLLWAGIVTFCICYVTEIWLNGIFIYTINSDTISTFFTFISCNWFFYLLLKQDEWIDIPKHAAFWFVTGLFLFSFCSVVTNLFDSALMNLFVSKKTSLRSLLYIVFNLILYGCWGYAYICRYQEKI